MVAQTQNYPLDGDLTLRDTSQSPLTVRAVALALTQQDDQLIECRLTLQVNPQLYPRIDTDALFNLKPDLRHPSNNIEFFPKPDLAIETNLKPDLLSHLAAHATPDKTATSLLSLSQEQPDHPLLSTESWLALSVKQHQESGEVGYHTIWSYISPNALTDEPFSSEPLSEGITRFFQEVVSQSLESAAQAFSTETLGSISHFFEELAQDNSVLSNHRSPPAQPIFQTVIAFFTQDDWSFTRIQGETALRLAFQGDNGAWNCYAQVREDQEQFAFYSICPIYAPETKRSTAAEFITRANYNMMIGNFEMDFADGEIRFKSSIDIEPSQITTDIIKRLVYANVTMMDEYLPGIIAVIEQDVLPEVAINSIEQAETNASIA